VTAPAPDRPLVCLVTGASQGIGVAVARRLSAEGLVRSATAELAGSGVTVNAVCPGSVDTPMTGAAVPLEGAGSTG